MVPNLTGRFARLWMSLRHGAAARAVGTMAFATGLGQLAIFATLPLLTRLYDPAAFGLHALVMAFVGTASVGACLSLELAVVSAASDQEADRLFAAALMAIPLTAGLSAVALGVLVGLGLFGFAALPAWCIPLGAAMVALNGLYVASRYRVLRQQNYPALVRATLMQAAARALAPLALFPVAPIWAGLSGGEATGRLVGVRGMLRSVWSLRLGTDVWMQPRRWCALVRTEYRYTAVLLATVLVDAGASLLISPLLAGTYGAQAAGHYFLVALIMVAPGALIGTAAADVIHVRGAKLFHDNPAALPAFVRKVALVLLTAGVTIYLPLYAVAPLLLPPIFGVKWPLLAEGVRALTPFIVVAFMASPCSRLLAAVNRPTLKVWSDVLRLLGVPVVIQASHAAGKTFIEALQYLGWFLAFAYLVYFVLTYAAVLTSVARKEQNPSGSM